MGSREHKNRILAVVAVGLVVFAAACGGGGSADDGERDRNVSGGAGTTQQANPAPYHVAIFRSEAARYWYSTGGWGYVCGGVVVNAQWVATSSDCVNLEGKQWSSDYFKVGVGSVDPWAPTLWENRNTRMFTVVAAITADSSRKFALLKLDRPIDFATLNTVRPIDLPFTQDEAWPTKGTGAQISGFGFTISKDTGRIENLRTALVDVAADRDDQSCGDWNDFWGNNRLCLAKGKSQLGGLACQGDVGGPVVVNVDNKPVLAGIISEINRVASCESDGNTLALRGREFVTWMAGGAIRDVTARPDDSSVTLSWSAPGANWYAYANEGVDWNPGVTDYVVEMSEDGGKTWETIADGENTNTELTISGLTNGKDYSFRIAALNEVLALRSDHRLFTAAVTATVGHVEEPVVLPDVEMPQAPEETPAPTLDGQAPMKADDPPTPPPAAVAASAPSTTAAPAGSTATTTAAAPATTTPVTSPAVSAQAASNVLSTFNPVSANAIATIANVSVPAGARVSITVDKSSKKICSVVGGVLVAKTTGNCKVKLAVASGKGKPKSKTTTVSVTK